MPGVGGAGHGPNHPARPPPPPRHHSPAAAAPAEGSAAQAGAGTAAPAPAQAAEAKVDTGDTAWMLTSTALVLMMTIPGLALFYAGMVRKKNVLATMMQSFAITAIVTVVWYVVGYSLAFTNGNAYIGDFSRVLLHGIEDGWDKPFTLGAGTDNSTANTIPETVYIMFQMTFAIITPALITGAFADRMKFSALVIFMVLWSIFVYAPIAHWVWSPLGWVGALGAADFAGGTVVHINAGIAGLMCALVLGKRVGFGHDNMAPHNLAYAVTGAGLLWVGWFGFNAGSAVGAGGRAGMAMLATQIATGAATLGLARGRMGRQGQALRARRGLRRGGRAGGDHPGLRLRAPRPGADHRHRRRHRLLLVGHLAQAHARAMTTAWTRSACTGWAASSARC